jgi:hypothetical protein
VVTDWWITGKPEVEPNFRVADNSSKMFTGDTGLVDSPVVLVRQANPAEEIHEGRVGTERKRNLGC